VWRKRSIFKGGLLATLLLQAQLSTAHLPEHYGREYVRVDAAPTAVAPHLDAAGSPPHSEQDDLFRYEGQLHGVERSHGPFSSGLTDPLTSVAQHHLKQGHFEDALLSYGKALHLVRINDGLQSDRQLPILREMMDIYRRVGDYSTLDEAHQYYSRLRKFDTSDHSQQWLDDALEYIAWERELYASGGVFNRRAPLIRAYRANRALLESSTPTTEEELDWHFRLCLSQMRNLYLVMGDEPLSMSGSLNSDDGAPVAAANRRIAFIQFGAVRKGRALLEGCIAHAQLSPPATLAALHLELGDWHQWNGQLVHASKQYLQVVELLRAAGEDHLLMQWLDQPVELPDEANLWATNGYTNMLSRDVVEAQYDVNSQGVAKRIKVSVIDVENEGQAWRIKRMLSNTHFRPRFSGGEAEGVEQLSRSYLLVGATNN
jgi:tetratricopeptide (TPR) repeat protein